eukprot:COSAG05_NODE_541_length_8832_cov_190.458491_13_plen_31_part_00
MKHRELGMKNGMLERNLYTHMNGNRRYIFE